MKNILIAGAHSYIGDSFKEYIGKYPEQYTVKILPTRNQHTSPVSPSIQIRSRPEAALQTKPANVVWKKKRDSRIWLTASVWLRIKSAKPRNTGIE